MKKHSALVVLFLLVLLATRIGGFFSSLQGNLVARDVAVWALSTSQVQFNDDWTLSTRLGGYLFLEQGRLADSVNLLERVAAKDRIASFWLGEAYVRLGRYDEAIVAWRGADSASYFLNLGHLSYAALDYYTACLYYLRAVEIAPDMAIAHMYSGHCYWRTGNVVLAEREYLRALQLDPEYGYPYLHLASLYVDGFRQPERARIVLEKCIEQVQSAYWVMECQKQLATLP